MTGEEAIRWLNQIKRRYIFGGDEGFDASRKEAIDIAIEALQWQDRILTQIEDIVSKEHGEKERTMTKEEAIELLEDLDGAIEDNHGRDYDEAFRMAIEALSIEANSDDLIIKGAKGIQDGLYNIKDGKLFKYKAKGGTVRTYEIVPSAEVQGEWKPKNHHTDYCSNCGFEETQWRTTEYNFCPLCGARMKGMDNEYTV